MIERPTTAPYRQRRCRRQHLLTYIAWTFLFLSTATWIAFRAPLPRSFSISLVVFNTESSHQNFFLTATNFTNDVQFTTQTSTPSLSNLRSVSSTVSKSASTTIASNVSTNSSLKTLLFMTTIFSDDHIRMFHCCWPMLLQHSKLLRNVDILIFSNNITQVPQAELDYLQHELFADHFRSNRLHFYFANSTELNKIASFRKPKNQFQAGANLGPQLGFQYGWFDDYDWMIRINPDVLIRNSTWLVQSMNNNNNNKKKTPQNRAARIDAILVDCQTKRIHTDFFAVRPKILSEYWKPKGDLPFSKLEFAPWNKPYPLNRSLPLNHEATARKYFLPLIMKSKSVVYVPDADPSKGICRVRGNHSSIYHGHDNNCQNHSHVCDSLWGWNIT